MLSLLRANWKRVLATVIGLNIVYFVQRTMFSDDCDVEAIIKLHRAMQDAAAATVVDSCTFARKDNGSRDPPETNWCMYNDEVDLRIIIMTFNRPASLLRLLRSVTSVDY